MSGELKTRRMLNYCRYVEDTIQADIENWNKVVTAFDLIDDTLLAMEFYLEQAAIDESGAGYVFIYGVLQALYIQQDADDVLTNALNNSLSLQLSPIKQQPRVNVIREMRNDVVGHPSGRGKKSGQANYFMLNRGTISKRGFKVVRLDGKNRDYDRFYDVENAIKDQIIVMKNKDAEMAEELREKELAHRKKFRDQKLTPIFSNADYFLGVLIQDLEGRGIAMINLLTDSLDKYEQAAIERGEAPKELMPIDLRYALNWLKRYLEGGVNEVSPQLSRIVAMYIHNEYPGVIRGAESLDEDYMSNELP